MTVNIMDPYISANRMTVDDFLNGNFMEGCDEEDIQEVEAVCLLCRLNFLHTDFKNTVRHRR